MMRRPSHPFRALTLLLALLSLSVPAMAQPAASYKNGAEFYMAYRAAFAKAKSIDELLPWMDKERRDQIGKTPAGDKKEMFGMIKAFDDHINLKVVKETPTATGAELQVEGISAAEKSKATAVIKLAKEGGAWKLSEESWKGTMGK
jgi:hypothetical protein